MDRDEFKKAYAKIVAKAWADDAFKQRLLSDPTTVLRENGVDVPESVQIKILESTSTTIPLILPPKPDTGETCAENLETRQAAMGSADGCCGPGVACS